MARLIFDFDGVLVRSRLPDRSFLWQQTIESDLNLPNLLRDQIFKQPQWNEIICGQNDFRTRLAHVFAESPNFNVEEFIRYWLAKDLNWYTSVLELAIDLKKAGHSLYLGTNQDQIRCEFIQKQPEIKNLFSTVFASSNLGVCKPSSEFYAKILQSFSNSDPSDFVVIDDAISNIEAAKSVGLNGIYFNPDFESTHTAAFLKASLESKIKNVS